MRMSVLIAAPALVLAACSQEMPPPVDDQAAEMRAAETDVPAGDDPELAGDPDGTAADQASGIPVALQGRWGPVPADCTSTRGDAKGLIEVTGDRISFYESRATLGEIAQRSDTSIRADFAFTGEGMEWTRDVSLAAEGDDQLVRTEYGEEALAEPLTYTKCA